MHTVIKATHMTYKYLHVYLTAVQTQSRVYTEWHIQTSQPHGQSPTINTANAHVMSSSNVQRLPSNVPIN